MKNSWIERFSQCGKQQKALVWDEEIALRPRELYGYSRHIHSDYTFVFDILKGVGGPVAGEIALRIGDSPEQFYLGHVGYHVDEPYRGHGYALRACRLTAPFLQSFGMRTAVITTDTDNRPSIRTCENLGCVLESTVAVPPQMADKLEISRMKRRFIWTL